MEIIIYCYIKKWSDTLKIEHQLESKKGNHDHQKQEFKALTNSSIGKYVRSFRLQKAKLLIETEGINVKFADDAIDEIAALAFEVNQQRHNRVGIGCH